MSLTDAVPITLEERLEKLTELTDQAEEINNKLLDMELAINAEPDPRKQAILGRQHNTMMADARRIQFSYEHLATDYSNLLDLLKLREIAQLTHLLRP